MKHRSEPHTAWTQRGVLLLLAQEAAERLQTLLESEAAEADAEVVRRGIGGLQYAHT